MEKYELNIDELPMSFDVTFGSLTYTMQLNYNAVGDYYTVDLYDSDYHPIVLGEKLIYGKRLWSRYTSDKIPAVDLTPLDLSGRTHTCNRGTFGKTVFLYTGGDDDGTSV